MSTADLVSTAGALLPLFVAVPLLLAGVSAVTRSRVLDRILAIGVPVASLAGAIWLLTLHQCTPVIATAVGSYEAGIAIPFVSDSLSALMLAVTGLATAAATWFLSLTGEDRYRFVPALALMLMSGVNGALLTGDLFNLFVFVEVMLLPSYALIAVTGSWRRLGIGRMFVIVNLVTSITLLMGVGLVYGAAGSVNLAVLAGAAAEDPQVAVAATVVLVALAIKAGVVPVHGWLPRAYPATSAGIMALFSALHTKVAVYALFRVWFTLFAPADSGTAEGPTTAGAFPAPDSPAAVVAVVMGVVVLVTMLVGAFGSLGEKRLRGVLAFQMTAGMGHILIGAVLGSPAAVAAGLFYLVHHVITMASLLTTAGAVEHTYGTGTLGRLTGLMHRERLAAVLIALGLLSLAGLPPTSGLWGKVGLMTASAEAAGSAETGAGVWGVLLMVGVLISSAVTLIALQRLWGRSMAGAPMTTYRDLAPAGGRGELREMTETVRIPGRLLAPGMVMMGVSVALFLGAGALMPVVQDAAHALLDTTDYVEAVLR